MNTHALAAEIVTKVRNSMQDSVLNQCAVVERMIREAIREASDAGANDIVLAINATRQLERNSVDSQQPP